MVFTINQLLFYVFAALAVFSACGVVLSRNPVKAVLFLVFAFFNMAGIWMLLEAEFLAIALVLVYVGAVMVLFLFVVMMLDIEVPKQHYFVRRWPVGILVALSMIGLSILAVGRTHFGFAEFPAPAPRPVDYSHVKAIAELFFNHYLYPFEVAAVILLVAMIAAIGLTFRGPRTPKGQNPGKQVRVRREDRIRLVKMQAEGGEA